MFGDFEGGLLVHFKADRVELRFYLQLLIVHYDLGSTLVLGSSAFSLGFRLVASEA